MATKESLDLEHKYTRLDRTGSGLPTLASVAALKYDNISLGRPEEENNEIDKLYEILNKATETLTNEYELSQENPKRHMRGYDILRVAMKIQEQYTGEKIEQKGLSMITATENAINFLQPFVSDMIGIDGKDEKSKKRAGEMRDFCVAISRAMTREINERTSYMGHPYMR